MTEQPTVSAYPPVADPEQDETQSASSESSSLGDGAAHHPSWAEVAAAVETSEEMNEADEVYAAELAALETGVQDDSEEVVDEVPVARDPDETPEDEPAAEVAAQVDEPVDDGTSLVGESDAEPLGETTADAEESVARTASVEAPEFDAEPAQIPEAIDDAGAVEVPEPVDDAQPVQVPEAIGDATSVETPESVDASETSETAETPEAIQTSESPGASADEPTPAPTPPSRPGRNVDPRPKSDGGGRKSDSGGSPGRPSPGGRRPSPSPRPGAGGAHTTIPLVPDPLIEPSDPTPWGRVDDDGTVYVITAEGERAVGSWQAGDPAAGLAHYGRRFDDFITEIIVLETRLTSGSGDAKATKAHAQMLRQSIDTLPAVGDLASAGIRLDAVIGAAEEFASAAAQERANARAAAMARREALCVEAEQLAESNQWKTSGDRLKEIVEEWRTIRGLDRKTDDQLWKRFSKARDTFIRRRGSHFAEMDKERGAAREAKEKLIAQAEKLADSTDWAETAGAYRDLMAEWKAAGRTSRDVEDALWQKFRDAQERFFARRQETFASRDAEFEANAAIKERLLAEAERIDPAAGLDAAKSALRSIQSRWEEAGKVPRERIRTLDSRLRAVEDKIKSAEDSLWRKTDPEATARLAQFRSRYETYQAQADKARASGDNKRASAAQAQANQWLEWLRAAENAVD